MKGLAISNSRMIRDAHNSLARYVTFLCQFRSRIHVAWRPADLRGALRTTSKSAISESRALKAKASKASPLKRPKGGDSKIVSKPVRKSNSDGDEQEETYHFIGYVPAHGKVWELDGLKSGPIEVGEIPIMASSAPGLSSAHHPNADWMDVVRPALRMKMRKYGGAAEGGNNIRFSLLALVNGRYQAVSDELEILKREKSALERRLDDEFPDGWHDNVCVTYSEKCRNIHALFSLG
jgi:ubiquitin carboxyl-terminal hydrolase L5